MWLQTEFPSDAQDVLERLRRVDLASPGVDPRRAEKALRMHLMAFGRGSLPIEWVGNAGAGFLAAERCRWELDWSATTSRLSCDVWGSVWPESDASVSGSARKALRRAAWNRFEETVLREAGEAVGDERRRAATSKLAL